MSEKIPASCLGVKCMVQNCPELASHKVGELNVWDEESQSEEYSAFNKSHELTSYLCNLHFDLIMTRDSKIIVNDNRKI